MSDQFFDPFNTSVPDGRPFISTSCEGEICTLCGRPAGAKIGEEIAWDDPFPNRHNLTAYVCTEHFSMLFHGGRRPSDRTE